MKRRSAKTARHIAMALAIVIPIFLLLSYFFIGYLSIDATLRTEAEANALFASRIIQSNPDYWRFEQIRLQEFLSRRLIKTPNEIRRIVDLNNATVAEHRDQVAYPFMMRSHNLYDSGKVVANLEIIRSLRPLLWKTLLVGFFGYLLAFTIFLWVKIFVLNPRQQAEEAQKESEERYRRLVELSPDAILVHADGRYVFANPAAARLFGVASPEKLEGKAVLDLVHPRYRDQVLKRMKKAVSGEPTEVREFQILRLDGRPGDVEVAGVGITYQGKPAAQVMMRDITARKQAEEELRKSNQRLDLLAETASQLLASDSPQKVVDSICQKAMASLDCDTSFNFIVDEKERRLHLNACAGIPDEEARRIEWLDYGMAVCGLAARDGCRIVKEDIQATTDPLTELVKSYGIQAHACHPLMAQGRVLGTLSFGTRTRPRFTPDELALMKAVADQVAIAIERKQAEEALRQSEQRERARATELQAVLDAVPAYIFLAHAPDCRYITGNSVSYELLGLPPGSNVSLSAAKHERPANLQVMKDGRELPAYEMPIQRAVEGEIVRDYEFEMVVAGGAGRHLLGNAVPLLDETGQPQGAVAAFIDVTARKQAEEALKASEARFRAIFEGAVLGIGLVDLEGWILVVNPAVRELLGFSVQEMVGRPWSEFIHCQDLPANLARFQEMAAGRLDHYRLEERYRHKDGHYLWADLAVSLVRGAEGQPLFAIAMGQDITARQEAKEKDSRYHKQLQGLAAQLGDVQEAERRLLTRELHDRVGQNLGVLGINLNLVQSLVNEGDKDQIQVRLDDSVALVEQTVGLIRDLVTELRPPELDDYGLLEALRSHGAKFSQRTNIAVDIVGEEPALRLDPSVEISLFRIVQEALTNVARHARATRVRVIQEVEAGKVRLTIADNGAGFDLTPQENVKGRQGWGLITMTERAVGVGGHCRIDSRPGEGTRVIVEVPR